MGKLDGKTALITGGNSGIGWATAEALVREGACVAICGRNQQSISQRLTELPPDALGLVARVERMADIEAMIGKVRQEFGGLDILVLCAGVMRAVPLEAVSVVQGSTRSVPESSLPHSRKTSLPGRVGRDTDA